MKSSIEVGRYTTVVPEIASEIFDGELVIANYQSGLYYSLPVEGSWIWQGLAHGLTTPQVSDWLAAHFPDQAAQMPAFVGEFVAKLLGEGLILEAAKGDSPERELPVLPKGVFRQPTVERFDDLQELLLLDPVHDVDQAGWPRRPTG